MKFYNGEKSSTSTTRLKEDIENIIIDNILYRNQQTDYQSTGLSNYDLKLIFQLLIR